MNGNSHNDKYHFTETNTRQMGFRWGVELGELLCQLNGWRNRRLLKSLNDSAFHLIEAEYLTMVREGI